MPLLTFDEQRDVNTAAPPLGPPPSYAAAHDEEEERDAPPRKWHHYLPTAVTFFLLLAPHPSLLKVLVNYHLRVLHAPIRFAIHLCITYALSLLAFSSLMTIILRDPGRVGGDMSRGSVVVDSEGDEINLTQALLSTDEPDFNSPGKWCRKCWAPKPERTHHCSYCGRCVLKMDHHCVWLGYKCVGHRTYTSFLHFLLCVTLLAIYVASLCISAIYFAFTNPLSIDESTPLHEMTLALAGIVITMVIGPFLLYHAYLVTTNQTTLEHLSPFLLLRNLPPLPRNASDRLRLSDPPLEHELSFSQRRLIRDAHGYIRLYDVGWRKNWTQLLGWDRPWGWVSRIAIGGGGTGDGHTFPRNPKADELLARLASELVDVDKVL